MKVAVDFDKTLTKGTGKPYWVNSFDEEPDERMIETTNELYHRGHTVFIYTARDESVRRETQMWLDRWGVKHHGLVMEKLGFDVLIDDRTMKPHNGLDADIVEQFVENHSHSDEGER